jgi:hypothetical protein
MDCLIRPKDVCGDNTGAMSANIECFCEFDKLGSRYIRSPHKDGHL